MNKLIFVLIISTLLVLGCTAPLDTNSIDSNSLVNDTNTSGGGFSNLEAFRKVKAGDNVSVHYILTVDGQKVESSYDRDEPLDFIVGAGQRISGFDGAVVGMKVGDKKTVTLIPEDAYGEVSNEVVYVGNDLFEEGTDLNVGMIFYNGKYNVEIVSVEDNNIGVIANHPMAGKSLVFDIELVKIN